jgi:hypothetical protein
VVLAARLAALARDGQALASALVRELAAGDADLRLAAASATLFVISACDGEGALFFEHRETLSLRATEEDLPRRRDPKVGAGVGAWRRSPRDWPPRSRGCLRGLGAG